MVGDILSYVHAHVGQPISRDLLARLCGYSVLQVHRILSERFGKSPAVLVRHLRTERAGRKLRHGAVDITEVALAAGYDTHAAFGKAFKKTFGMSPRQFSQLDCWNASSLLGNIGTE